MPRVVLTEFARPRLFPKDRRITAIQDVDAEGFVAYLNQNPPARVLAGYAPFCQLWAYPNWTSTRCSVIAIDEHNRHLLRSGYEARTREELPVLVRWFEGLEAPRAAWLLPILYNAEQLAREGAPIDADWGIVGCLYTMQPEEIPMAPATMLRNALGIAEGGSGVPLDRDAYLRSVAFWEHHANWRP